MRCRCCESLEEDGRHGVLAEEEAKEGPNGGCEELHRGERKHTSGDGEGRTSRGEHSVLKGCYMGHRSLIKREKERERGNVGASINQREKGE